MPQITTKISNFSDGISDDIREVALNKFSISKHFDIFTNPKKLIPYRDVEDESPAAGNAIGNFIYSSLSELIALGKVIGQNWPCLYWKAGASLVTDAWAYNRSNWVGTAGVVDYNLFIEYNSCIYFAVTTGGTNYLVKGTVLYTTAALDEDFGTLSALPTGQGLVHSKSATLFIPCGNKIDKVISAGTFSANQAPSISSNLSITSLSEYGSYLAIGCRDTTGGNSKVIIWDMVSTTTFIDVIDWGRDELYVLNNLEGYLVGIANTQSGLFSGNDARISIQLWGGGKPILAKELYARKYVDVATAASATIYPRVNFIKDNKLYFAAKLYGGTAASPLDIGIWVFGRKNSNYNWAATLDRFATTDNSETSIVAAIMLGSILWVCHTEEGTVTRTNDNMTSTQHSATSIYESQKFNGEIHGYDSSYVKNLVEVSLTCDKLPTDATAKLYYRVDGATSWGTAFLTISTATRLSEFINVGIGDYKEIEWRIESYKMAKITGFSFTEDVIGKKKQV